MLPRKDRLGREDFERSRRHTRRVHGSLCAISFMPSPTFGVGVVVSKKVARKAVARNLLRRRVYAVFADIKKDLSTSHSIVFLKKEAAGASYDALREDIVSALHKAHLILRLNDTERNAD